MNAYLYPTLLHRVQITCEGVQIFACHLYSERAALVMMLLLNETCVNCLRSKANIGRYANSQVMLYMYIDGLVSYLRNCFLLLRLKQFSVECCETKTKVITLTYHKGHLQLSEPTTSGFISYGL